MKKRGSPAAPSRAAPSLRAKKGATYEGEGVVTLREVNGVNRINELMQQRMAQRWIVERIDIDQRVALYEAAEVDIEFEDE